MIGVIISNAGAEIKEINLQKNQSFILGNFDIKFSNLDYRADKNFIARIGVFEVTKNNKIITTLKPELRLYPINDRTTNESSIYHHPLYDLYVVIGTKDENENYAIRAYFKPMISLIWTGVALIFFGILSRFLKIFSLLYASSSVASASASVCSAKETMLFTGISTPLLYCSVPCESNVVLSTGVLFLPPAAIYYVIVC
jgi:cytochrome c biogenesis factor